MPYHCGTATGRRMLQALLTSAALLVGSGAADAASIRDTVQAALDTNPEITVVQADRRAVDQELRQARALYYPSIDLRGAIGPEYTDLSGDRRTASRGPNADDDTVYARKEAQLTLTQMLFDGFETQSEVARQTARVSSAAHRVQEAAEFIGLNAIEAHLEVLRFGDIVALNEANVAQHERLLGQVRQLEEAGRSDVADVRQSEARVAQTMDNLASARGSYADAIADYIEVVGLEPAELVLGTAPAAALPAGREEAATLASVSSPTVLIAASDVDVAEAELKGARAGYYPRFDIELSANAQQNTGGVDGRELGASALLVSRYNLYRGGADVAREREAFHRLNEARAQVARARRQAEQEARLSYNALLTARERTEALRVKAEAQRRTRDAYASQFELGVRDLLDLLDAENEYFNARVALVTAEYTETFAIYRVLAVVGELLDTLEVTRPRETISIYRTPADVQTPEAVQGKTDQLLEPRAEPRPLRGTEAGEPPIDALDAAKVVR